MSVWDESSSAGCGGANPMVSPPLLGELQGTPSLPWQGCTARDDCAGCAGSHSRSADKQQETHHCRGTGGELGTSQGVGTLSAAASSFTFCQPQIRVFPQWAAAAIRRFDSKLEESNRKFYYCLPVIVSLEGHRLFTFSFRAIILGRSIRSLSAPIDDNPQQFL